MNIHSTVAARVTFSNFSWPKHVKFLIPSLAQLLICYIHYKLPKFCLLTFSVEFVGLFINCIVLYFNYSQSFISWTWTLVIWNCSSSITLGINSFWISCLYLLLTFFKSIHLKIKCCPIVTCGKVTKMFMCNVCSCWGK